MSDPVLTEVRGNVLIVTLNRPEKANALAATLVAALHAAIDDPRRADRAAALLALAYILGSDVRGRSAAMVAMMSPMRPSRGASTARAAASNGTPGRTTSALIITDPDRKSVV